MIELLLAVLGAYLIGSVSSAILICRMLGLPDPRTEGSGNPGATNVLRVGGRKAAALTLAGDFLKGTLPVVAVVLLGLPEPVIAAAGLAAFAGHLFPVFFGFRGGKGVATGLGVLLGWHWLLLAAVAGTWLVVAVISRISSLSALVAFALAPVYVWLISASPALTGATVLMTALIYWRHTGNIRNILAGTESRIGAKKG